MKMTLILQAGGGGWSSLPSLFSHAIGYISNTNIKK